jgi:membrane protein YqaA with SNARE-associated domain
LLKKLFDLFNRYKLWLLGALKPLGFWGIGCISVVDSAAVPVPIDLIIAGYVWADKKHFYLYVLACAAGSALGGLVPFVLGRIGGELFLMKRINRQQFERLRDRFERQEFFAIMIPSMLPPPTPWKLFVFGAGVFEMRTANFMLAVFVGRMVRFSVTAVLTIEYGPQIVNIATDLATRHSMAVLAVIVVLIGLAAAWMLRKWRVKKQPGAERPEI